MHTGVIIYAVYKTFTLIPSGSTKLISHNLCIHRLQLQEYGIFDVVDNYKFRLSLLGFPEGNLGAFLR